LLLCNELNAERRSRRGRWWKRRVYKKFLFKRLKWSGKWIKKSI